MRRRTDGMVTVITGASSGIGRALAEQLAALGGRLVLAARRMERLEALNTALGNRHLCVQTDVALAEQCQRLIDRAAERFGRIDTLVCNAGIGIIRPAHQLGEPELREMFETNVLGTTACIRAATPVMLAQPPRDGWRGQVVIVSSAAARRGLPCFGGYSATKAAQLSLAEALRVELKAHGISVTSVHPCGTSTEFFRAAIRRSRMLPPRRNAIELHQSAAEVAQAIVAAMQKPRPEVWPVRRFRWVMALATLFPAITDAITARRTRARTAPADARQPATTASAAEIAA